MRSQTRVLPRYRWRVRGHSALPILSNEKGFLGQECCGSTGNLPQKEAEAALTWKPELCRHRKKQSSNKAISASRLIEMMLNLTVGNKKQTENSDLWANTGSCRARTSESSHLDMSRTSPAPASFAWREKIHTQRIRPRRNIWPLAAFWLNYSTGLSLENATAVLCCNYVIQWWGWKQRVCCYNCGKQKQLGNQTAEESSWCNKGIAAWRTKAHPNSAILTGRIWKGNDGFSRKALPKNESSAILSL